MKIKILPFLLVISLTMPAMLSGQVVTKILLKQKIGSKLTYEHTLKYNADTKRDSNDYVICSYLNMAHSYTLGGPVGSLSFYSEAQKKYQRDDLEWILNFKESNPGIEVTKGRFRVKKNGLAYIWYYQAEDNYIQFSVSAANQLLALMDNTNLIN
jgi:hypothetical protein